MTTYAANEASVQDAQLREIYSFVLANANHQLTTHDEDVTYNSVLYSKTVGLSRGNAQQAPLTNLREMIIKLPRTHAIVSSLMPSPPRVATISVVRIFADSTSASTDRRQIWYGQIAGLDIIDEYAHLKVPGAIDVAFDVDAPFHRITRTCPHQLYSVGCGITRQALFRKLPTVSVINGIQLTVSSLAPWANQLARFGEVVRLADGERRSILDHTGNVLTLDVPFNNLLTIGDALEVWQGCDKLPNTCSGKFLNLVNFGGHKDVPAANPMSPTGRGLR